MRVWPICLLPIIAALPARAQDAQDAAALITTASARQGSLPDIVTAYGAAGPAQNGGLAISLQQDGRVAAIMVTQGERVPAGARLLAFDIAPASASAYSQAVSALSLARTERAHTAQLLAQRLATRDQLAQAEKTASDARATLDALTRQGGGRGRIMVTAPFDGVVEALPVAQGDRVAAGAPLLTLTRMDGLVVTVGVDPSLYTRVLPGQTALVQPLDGTQGFDGKILRVDGVVNPKTRLLDVDIAVPAGRVISGELFRAEITLGGLVGWIVPHDAVLDDERGFFLFQVNGAKAARVDLRVLATQGDVDAVDAKLDPQRPVIVDGATQLSDGDPVRTTP